MRSARSSGKRKSAELNRAVSATGAAACSASGKSFFRARTATSPVPAARTLSWMVVPWTDATFTPPAVLTRIGPAEQGTRLRRLPQSRENLKAAETRTLVPTASAEWARVLPGGTSSRQFPASSDQTTASGAGWTEAATSSAAARAFTRRA
jgi:hypothetical protein